jgi:hypothetical protein
MEKLTKLEPKKRARAKSCDDPSLDTLPNATKDEKVYQKELKAAVQHDLNSTSPGWKKKPVFEIALLTAQAQTRMKDPGYFADVKDQMKKGYLSRLTEQAMEFVEKNAGASNLDARWEAEVYPESKVAMALDEERKALTAFWIEHCCAHDFANGKEEEAAAGFLSNPSHYDEVLAEFREHQKKLAAKAICDVSATASSSKAIEDASDSESSDHETSDEEDDDEEPPVTEKKESEMQTLVDWLISNNEAPGKINAQRKAKAAELLGEPSFYEQTLKEYNHYMDT